ANFIDGGDGSDLLQGNRGRDLLFGGGGMDRLAGSLDDDILCGGIYHYANDADAITALLAEWTRNDLGYAARVQNLKAGLGRTAGFALKIETITDDLMVDELLGQQQDDFFLIGDNVRTDILNKEIGLDI